MKMNILKLLYIFLFFASCKHQNVNEYVKPQKKKNILEHTKWKSSATGISDVDIILDFYTESNVQEYIQGHNGKQIKGRQGSYKIRGRNLKITWAGVTQLEKNSNGTVNGKSIVLTERLLRSRTYYKLFS